MKTRKMNNLKKVWEEILLVFRKNLSFEELKEETLSTLRFNLQVPILVINVLATILSEIFFILISLKLFRRVETNPGYPPLLKEIEKIDNMEK